MRKLLLGLMLLAGVGCTNVQPIGPLAKRMGKPPAANKDADPPEPVTVPAPRPAPPAALIEPDEVTADSAAASVQKLTNELDYDAKTLPPPPKTADISRNMGGVKHN
jgi:hypothetical protein